MVTNLNGTYITSKTDSHNKAPVHLKQLMKEIPEGFQLEVYRENKIIEILDPKKMLTVTEFFNRFGDMPCGKIPGKKTIGIIELFPETLIALIRARRL